MDGLFQQLLLRLMGQPHLKGHDIALPQQGPRDPNLPMPGPQVAQPQPMPVSTAGVSQQPVNPLANFRNLNRQLP
jgi:hypothetical protein